MFRDSRSFFPLFPFEVFFASNHIDFALIRVSFRTEDFIAKTIIIFPDKSRQFSSQAFQPDLTPPPNSFLP
jgi:hypothetical protein